MYILSKLKISISIKKEAIKWKIKFQTIMMSLNNLKHRVEMPRSTLNHPFYEFLKFTNS